MSEPVQFEELTAKGGRRVGIAALSAGERLNALSMHTVDALGQQLTLWERDERIALVALHATSEKAFCAGGDLRELYRAETASDRRSMGNCGVPSSYVRLFFEQEYRLDFQLHTFGKPLLCWGHGLVMGGGLGLLVGCSHRVVTEGSRLSMPEIAIGHFPDVGASWFLNRMPGKTGLFHALTGAPIGPDDALYANLADYRIEHEEKQRIFDQLLMQPWGREREDNDALLGRVLRSAGRSTESGERPLLQHGELILDLCSRETLPEIIGAITALQDDSDPWLRDGARRLAKGYPGSAWLIFTLLRRVAHLSLADVFRLEYLVALRSVVHGQFIEGIRALIIDKDRRPQWDQPIENLNKKWVEQTFLTWPPEWNEPLADLSASREAA